MNSNCVLKVLLTFIEDVCVCMVLIFKQKPFSVTTFPENPHKWKKILQIFLKSGNEGNICLSPFLPASPHISEGKRDTIAGFGLLGSPVPGRGRGFLGCLSVPVLLRGCQMPKALPLTLGIWNSGGLRCVVQLCQTQKFSVVDRDLLGILIGKDWSLFLTFLVQDIFNSSSSPNE